MLEYIDLMLLLVGFMLFLFDFIVVKSPQLLEEKSESIRANFCMTYSFL